MSDWWLSRASGSPEGPFPPNILIQGLISEQIPTHAYVCRVGDQSWVRIHQVDEIWGQFTSNKPEEKSASSTPLAAESSSKRASVPSSATSPLDTEDENEQTRIIAPIASDDACTEKMTTKARVSENGHPSKITATPQPRIPSGQHLPEPHQPRPHDASHPVPQNAAASPIPRMPTQQVVAGARLVPTPLPYLPSPMSRLEAPRTNSEPPPNLPIRAKIPAQAGISEPITTKLPHTPGSAVAAKGSVSPSASIPPIPGISSAPQNIVQQTNTPVKSRTEATLPSTVSTKGGLLTPQAAPQPNVSAQNVHGNVQRGLAGLGLSPLPKAQTTALPLAGLSSLAPFPKPGQPILTPLPIRSIESESLEYSGDSEETRPLAPRGSVATANKPTLPNLPPILGAKRTAKSEPNGPSHLPSTPNAMSVLGTKEPVFQQSAPLLDESGDVDDVTTVSKSAFLEEDEALDNAFDNDVTKLVNADQLPDTERYHLRTESGTQPAKSPVITPVPLNSPLPTGNTSAPQPNAIALPSPTESNRDTSGNHSAKPALPARAHKSSPTSAPVDAPQKHDELSELDSSNFDAHVTADPSELLEEDTDDTSMPIRMISSIPPPLTASKEHEKPASVPSVKPRAIVAGPVISVPPKAVHVAPGPSIVLRPEPVVHQEATKPAVRSIRQPGVIQITYGTLVIAILGIALFVLLLVLVLK